MKIRTQILISMAFFGLALIVISASVLYTNQHVDRLNGQEELAKNAELKANELSYLANDYLLFHESQQLDRWNEKYASLSADLSAIAVDTPDQQVLVGNIRENQRRLKDVFSEIVASVDSRSRANLTTADPAFLQVSWNRIGVQTQGIVFDAGRLEQKIRDEKDNLRFINYMLIAALLGIFGLFLLTSYYLIYRRTLKSIADLQAGTQIVGSGNLDHVIVQKGTDEFGELTGAFNRMTTRLKTVTASKTDLEHEVTERKKVEDALRASEASLVKANDELQVKQEELQVQNEEREVQLEELRSANDELEKVSSALRESQSRLETVFAAIPDVVVEYDADGNLIRANEIALKVAGITMPGYTRDIIVRKVEFKNLDGSPVKSEELPTSRARHGEIVRAEQYRIRTADGKESIISAYAAPLYKDGQVSGAVGLWHDITELKQTEKELTEAKMQAELYLDLMGHDINNMHQIAMNNLELAQEILDLDDEERELILKPLETMIRSAKLIDNVRKIQKVQRGELKDNAVDLGEVLGRIVGEYRDISGNKLNFSNGKGPYRVMANELLYDVFANLVGNAIKHSNGSAPNIAINVNTAKDGTSTFYLVSVEDSGPGIPDDMKEKVFNRLQRGETKSRGMGLGLYLVKSLVDSYHGRVWVEDRVPGDHTKGAKFVVMLPAFES